jgi:hypothetical protein
MKRWLLAALLGLLGCGNDSALAPPACGQRCHGEVVTLTWNEGFVMPVDLVLIADPALLVGSGAEVRYQRLMSSIGQRRFDLHLAVLPASPGPAGRLLPRGTDCAADLPFIDAPRTCGMAPNYDGAVEGLVSCLIGPATGLAHQPLEALRLALAEARPGSFLRPTPSCGSSSSASTTTIRGTSWASLSPSAATSRAWRRCERGSGRWACR